MVKKSALAVLCLLVVAMVVPHATSVSCEDAVNTLLPCGAYLIGAGSPKPSPECCQSAQKLNNLAPTQAKRQTLCQCLKDSGPSFGVKPERAKQLPIVCKVKLNIPIVPNVDCTKVT